MYSFSGKKIFITGVCGTIGSAIVGHLLSGEYGENIKIVGVDNNESEVFFISNEYRDNSAAKFLLCDIRDSKAIARNMRGAQVVIHTAALKHVVICEDSPDEMLSTNLYGLQNIIDAALLNNVEKVLFTSSDKAVNPSSNMGASKLLGEGLIRSAASDAAGNGPVFASTRFGNVLGSRGSVIPIFERQIRAGDKLTLTHRDMTRFIMGIDDAVKLVLDSVILAKGGEIFVTKMPIIRIQDLAEVMIAYYKNILKLSLNDQKIVEIGIKQGEKLYEELMTDTEAVRAIELERYFVIFPNIQSKITADIRQYGCVVADSLNQDYTSVGAYLSQEKLLVFLTANHLLN